MDQTDILKLFDSFNAITPNVDFETMDSFECSHYTHILGIGVYMCRDCGIELTKSLDSSDMKNVIEPNRCYIRKSSVRTIEQDLTNMNINDNIKDIANGIYMDICKGKVHRGMRRRAIIFASVFHAYKIVNNPQSCESLIKLFQIKRKDALKGLKYVNENSSKESPIRSTCITPEHLIHEFLCKFKVSEEKANEIIQLYQVIKDKSSILNRSRPQSVASGVIWYWIKLNKKQINISEFTKKVDLSELTVSKMAKEIARLYETTL